MVIRDINNLHNDPKLAEALGNMVVAWARAETALSNVFACVANIHINQAMMAYYRIPTFESRTKVIQAMLGEWKSSKYDRAKIEKAVIKLSKLASTRNNWIHGIWCEDKDSHKKMVFNLRAPEDTPRRRKFVKASDVLNHVNAVKKRTAKLDELVAFPYKPDHS